MGWEKRGNKRYYYHKIRRGRRVISLYLGSEDDLVEPIVALHRRRQTGRFIRACESLARVRKLIHTTPTLQLNVAASGSQQVNLVDAQPLTKLSLEYPTKPKV